MNYDPGVMLVTSSPLTTLISRSHAGSMLVDLTGPLYHEAPLVTAGTRLAFPALASSHSILISPRQFLASSGKFFSYIT